MHKDAILLSRAMLLGKPSQRSHLVLLETPQELQVVFYMALMKIPNNTSDPDRCMVHNLIYSSKVSLKWSGSNERSLQGSYETQETGLLTPNS